MNSFYHHMVFHLLSGCWYYLLDRDAVAYPTRAQLPFAFRVTFCVLRLRLGGTAARVEWLDGKAKLPQEDQESRRVHGLVAGFGSAGLVVVFLTGLLFNSTSMTSNG